MASRIQPRHRRAARERAVRRSASISGARSCSSGSWETDPACCIAISSASQGRSRERAARPARGRAAARRSPPARATAVDRPRRPVHDRSCRRGVCVDCRPPAARRCPAAAISSPSALGLPASVDNDANLAALAEHRYGAAAGTDERRAADDRDRDRRRADHRRPALPRLDAAPAASSATWSSTRTAHPATATARIAAASRRSSRARRSPVRAEPRRSSEPDSVLGRARGRGARDRRSAR